MNSVLNGRRINFEETKRFLREQPQFQCSSCDEWYVWAATSNKVSRCKAYRMKLAACCSFYEEFVLIYDKQGFSAVLWTCFVLTTVIRQKYHIDNCTVDKQRR
ncbi:hypothetical protein T4D_7918 [Trichinella pseudospiralis]|uniref:Uncharacterized protein n=1 Tax=Trichinella pseudospiralis TaxID=6337 RepID=A0A0V1F5W3_TRIPS|nr:hypothetical protein T4D_5800 [Trichinella pseudospiralis]KRY81620.1 hypothetical protein T4D_7918 [Trichinella pseudospiralis]